MIFFKLELLIKIIMINVKIIFITKFHYSMVKKYTKHCNFQQSTKTNIHEENEIQCDI